MDSPLYAPAEVAAARERTRAHYEQIGVPAMAAAYRHHTWDEVAPFEPTVAYRPRRPGAARDRPARPPGTASPFPWLIIGGGGAA